MCGICGIAGRVNRRLLEGMTAVIAHRGPDDAGVWIADRGPAKGGIGLGNRRLSILDLSSAGHMPMPSSNGQVWLTYNGEVYNFGQLRQRLMREGHAFRSHTDTEVLIHLYQEDGLAFLDQLNGMFALALWDDERQQLLLARDRYGIKPLYYVETDDGRLLFGSELKSILIDPSIRRTVNIEALDAYLRFGWAPGPQTLLKGVFKLPPGHYLLWRNGKSHVQRYWDMAYDEASHSDEATLTEELRDILEKAVRRHLVSDVPVGVFLSGGLDSSAILGLATRITGGPVRAYTITFRQEDAALEQAGQQDARHARAVAAHFAADYQEILVQPDVAHLLPEVVYAQDEPVADHAAILTLLIARAANPQVKVLLTGQGADEVFAGYRAHSAAQLAGMVGHVPQWMRNGPLRRAVNALPALPLDRLHMPPGRRLAGQRYLLRLLDGAGLSMAERYIASRSYYRREEQDALYSPALRQATAAMDAAQWHRGYFATASERSTVNRMLYTDLKTFLPELNLAYSDKLTAAASVEGRVPFLDNEVVDFAGRLPVHLKLHGRTGKYLLRRAMRGIVPDTVIDRPKAGFGAPVRKWLRDELRPMVHELLGRDAVVRRGYFDPAAIERLVQRNETGEDDQPMRVWALLTLEVWHQVFLDSPTPQPQTDRQLVLQ